MRVILENPNRMETKTKTKIKKEVKISLHKNQVKVMLITYKITKETKEIIIMIVHLLSKKNQRPLVKKIIRK